MSVSISGAGSISGLDQGFNVTTGNVGIGTDDASWGVSTGLIVGDGASAKGITIFSNSANVGDLAFADATSGTARYRGLIRYDHSDNSLALRTNSTERLRIDSNGRLLLGSGAISLPKGSGAGSFDLDNGSITMCIGGNINSTGRTNSTDKIARFTAPHYTNAEQPVLIASAYNVSGNNTISYGGGTSLCNAATSHIFYTATDTTTVTGTERLRILSNGIVQLATDAVDFANGTGYITAKGSGDLVFRTTNSYTERLRITSTGRLDLAGNMQFTAANPELEFNNGGPRFRVPAANTLTIHTGGGLGATSNERLRITSAGLIGIGEDNPSTVLHVAGSLTLENSSGTGNAWTYYKNADRTWLVGVRGSSNDVLSFYDLTTDVERLRIDSAGKLTVTPADTTSSYATTDGGIDIAQTISSTGTSSSQSIGIQFSLTKSGQTGAIAEIGAIREGSGLSGLVFRTRDNSTGRNERLRISSDGKVCVGTTLTNYGVLQIRDASGDSTTSAIQVENASSGNSTTNVILRSVSLNSGAWANAEYRAKGHVFSHQTSPVLTVLPNFGPWAEGNKGTTRGTLHLRPQSTDHMGGAITFGASDRDSGDTAMAGIYTRTDGNYGTKMYFATTNSYAAGPKNAMAIDQYGYVTNNNNPSFLAYNFTTRAMGNNLIAASTYHNTGNNYSTSTGIFTAPVAGHYMFGFALLHSNSPTTYARVLFRKNGNYTTQYGDTLISEPGSYVPTSATVVFYMNVNDTMQLFNEGNEVYGYQYGSFSGHFLG